MLLAKSRVAISVFDADGFNCAISTGIKAQTTNGFCLEVVKLVSVLKGVCKQVVLHQQICEQAEHRAGNARLNTSKQRN
jgi:hypothetical protein